MSIYDLPSVRNVQTKLKILQEKNMSKTDNDSKNIIFYMIILGICSAFITCYATGDQWDKDTVTKPKCKFYFEPDCKDFNGGN